jgi:hypothetical protein
MLTLYTVSAFLDLKSVDILTKIADLLDSEVNFVYYEVLPHQEVDQMLTGLLQQNLQVLKIEHYNIEHSFQVYESIAGGSYA